MVLRTAWLNTYPSKRSKQKKWGRTYYYIANQDTHILVRKLLQNIIYIYLEYLNFYQQGSQVHHRLWGSVSSSDGVGCVTMSTPGMINVSGLCFGIQLIVKPWFVQSKQPKSGWGKPGLDFWKGTFLAPTWYLLIDQYIWSIPISVCTKARL